MYAEASPPRSSFLPQVVAPLIRWQAGRHGGSDSIAIQQARNLRNLVRRLRNTRIGESHDLASLAPLRGEALREAFRNRVPLQRYADIEGLVSRVAAGEPDVLFPGTAQALAQTSGTTSAMDAGERWIPQNKALLDHHARGAIAALDRLLDSAGAAPLRGRLLMLGGSTSLTRNAAGIPTGDLSGITVDRIPWYLEGTYEPGREIALDGDWTRKIERIAERLAHADVTLVSGIPSWCAVLFEAVCRRRGVERLQDAWPNLRAFLHGGVSIDPYLPLLRRHLAPDTWMQEVYPSSEAFLGIGARAWKLEEDRAPDLELLLDHGVVLEFLPESETDSSRAIGPESLRPGVVYCVLASTPGGLLRYELGDLLEGRGNGRVRFAGRIRTRISVFGEHVESTRLAEALAAACRRTDCVVAEWHVAPILPSAEDPRGAHEWWIEFASAPLDPARFAEAVDDFLRANVIDYDAHRVGDVQLRAPRVRPVSPGTFHRSLASIGKLGGQHKIPTAWGDRTWADRLASHDTGHQA
jgi:hypothetical protein